MRCPCLLLTVALAGCAALEDRLVYFPTPASRHDTPLPAILRDVDLSLPDGTPIHARWCPHPAGNRVILYCHGNGGNLEHLGGLVHDFWDRLHASVLIFDYPGYGKSGGKPSEAGCYASAQSAYDWLIQEKKLTPQQIILVGESLGGGVAVELASRNDHGALILVRTFTSLPDVAAMHYSWLPVHAWMTNRYDSEKRLASCRRPVFIAQADNDRLMPFAHAERLRQACAGPCRTHVLTGLGHNDPLPGSFFTSVREFVEEQGL